MNQHPFIKVGIVVPQITLGQPLKNAEEIMRIVKNDLKASILLFPELTITGYSVGDWMFNRELINENMEAIRYLLDHNDDHLLIIGTMLEIKGSLYNVALIIEKNKIIGIVPKQFLPRSREFSDPRFFANGKNLMNTIQEIELFGQIVPIGDLLFMSSNNQITFGVEVCGDIWAPISPSAYLYTKGAEVIFNLSASTFHMGKHQQRLILTQAASLKGMGAYLYVSTGISETSSDIVYTGHQIACENGDLLLNKEDLSFESVISYVDIDIEKIKYARISSGWLHEYSPKAIRTVNFNLSIKTTTLEKLPNATPFVPKTNMETEAIIDITCSALYKRLKYIETKSVVIGISGGLDSTLALLFVVETFKRYQIDLKNIFAITMPSFGTTKESHALALNLMKKLNVTDIDLPIEEEVKNHLKLINHKGLEDITFENVQARYRTLVLMNKANQVEGIVIGTSDMSEIALGWSTFNGDHMSMYSVNSGLPKTTVRHLVKYFINKYPELEPELTKISSAVISPELTTSPQATEDKIGKYLINDFIMYHLLINGSSKERLVYLLAHVFKLNKSDAEKYYQHFIHRFKRQQFKRLSMPEGVKIFEVSLSPRSDVKMPGDLY